MSLNSYDGLKQSIIDHLERDDLSSHVDDFIDLAEARHKDDVRIRAMLNRSTLSIAADDQYIDLFDDFLDLKYLRIQVPDSTSGRSFLPDLMQVTIDEITDRSQKHAACPRCFAVHSQIELHAPADQAYTAEVFYYSTLDPLDDSNSSNALLARAPGAYLYGALSAAAPFLMHDERVPLWEGLYASIVDKLNRAEQDNRRGGPLVARVKGI